jgi:3-oxoacyl-[acyl-carrier-protein] synthase-1
MPVFIDGVGALCAVGRGIVQVDASVRAGIGRMAASSIMDGAFEPTRMALLPEPAIEPLAATLIPHPLTARQIRMVRLAASPLRECFRALPASSPPPPLFLGLPEGRASERIAPSALVAILAAQAAVSLDAGASRAFPLGRAAALMALEAAIAHLAAGKSELVVVGGVDTYLDLVLLGELSLEGRILGSGIMDGFVPGEGAAFLLLSARRRSGGQAAGVRVVGTGSAQDPGHRYSDKPARGEGLSQALEALFKAVPGKAPPIRLVYAGFNGESFGAKEWGVARIRHSDCFAQAARVEHPADCYGDAGAATGTLLLALATEALRRGTKDGPALVFASSDREARACALLELLT